MDQFHIAETLGSGKHSTVYKARRRKTIAFCAIKRVEKSQKDRVLQEITTMNEVQHPHVLQFMRWYETSKHLWMVLEYCVGGDLQKLLEKDHRLPEPSIHDFARGIASSLQYCHHKSVIYADLKPSNVLLDENGRIKLGGFGLSRRLAVINGDEHAPQPSSGTPFYMAPELHDGGVHSTASDLWALGCVLYQCAAGRLPFQAPMLEELIDNIKFAPPQPLSGASPEFSDLVFRLLDKNPATRLDWAGMRAHPFWKRPLPELALPSETALQAYIQSRELRSGPDKARWQDEPGGKSSLRVSRIVRRNLEAEAAGAATEYGAASAGAGAADVKLHTPDAEVDFDERASDAGGSESGDEPAPSAAVDNSAVEGASGKEEKSELAALADGSARVSFANWSPQQAAPQQQEVAPQQQQQQQQQAVPMAPVGCGAGAAPRQHPMPGGGAPAPPRSPSALAAAWGGVPSDAAVPPAVGRGGPPPAEALIWHASDGRISPIVANPRIERIPQAKCDKMLLPVPAWDAGQLMSAEPQDRDAFLTAIFHALATEAPIKDKTNVLAYIEVYLSCHTNPANLLINSDIAGLLVRMLRGASASRSGREKDGLKARLAGVLGMLLRHATSIDKSLAGTGIVEVLTLAASDKSEKVQRRATAALGELLFYIASTVPEVQAPGGAAGRAGGWQVPPAAVNVLCHLLRPGADEIAQHYAAHTLENVVTMGSDWARRFAEPAFVSNLISLWSVAKNEGIRGTAASGLARLLRHSPQQLAALVGKFGTRIFVSGLADPSVMVQTGAVNMLAQTLAIPDVGHRIRASLQAGPHDERSALGAALALLDSPEAALRAKGCLLVALLVRGSPHALAAACNGGLPAAAEKLAGQADDYARSALKALHAEVAAIVPGIIDQVLAVVRGGARLRASAWAPGGPAANFAAAVPSLLGCEVLATAVASQGLVDVLAQALEGTAGASPEDAVAAQLKVEVLAAVEALAGRGADMLLPLGPSITAALAPALAGAAAGAADADTRFTALKMLLDISLPFLAEPVDPEGGGHNWAAELEAVVTARLLSAVGPMLADDPPMPLFTLKLLAALLDARPAWAMSVARTGLVPCFVEFMALQHPNNNVHNLRVVRLMVTGGALPPSQLLDTGAMDMVAEVLMYTYNNQVALFKEPVLELCTALLAAYLPSANGRPSPFGAAAAEGAAEVARGLLPALPVFIELSSAEEPGPAALAAQAAAGVARLSPHDAAEILFSREGASLVAASLLGGPPGAACEPARRGLLICIAAAAAAARGTGAAVPDAVRQLRAAVHRLPSGGSELEAAAGEAAVALAALRS